MTEEQAEQILSALAAMQESMDYQSELLIVLILASAVIVGAIAGFSLFRRWK